MLVPAEERASAAQALYPVTERERQNQQGVEGKRLLTSRTDRQAEWDNNDICIMPPDDVCSVYLVLYQCHAAVPSRSKDVRRSNLRELSALSR